MNRHVGRVVRGIIFAGCRLWVNKGGGGEGIKREKDDRMVKGEGQVLGTDGIRGTVE